MISQLWLCTAKKKSQRNMRVPEDGEQINNQRVLR